jgi:hypothetical protein
MKLKPHHIFLLGITLMGSVLFPTSASAQIIYNFNANSDPQYVTSSQPLRNVDGTNWAVASGNRNFSTNVMSPLPANYTGPAFFGGFNVTSGQGAWGAANIRFDNTTASNRRMQLQYNNGGSVGTPAAGSMDAVFGFIPSQPVQLGQLTGWTGSLSTGIDRWATTYVTFAIETGGQWYTRSTAIGNWTTTTFNFSITDFTTQNWTLYSPSASMVATQGGGSPLASTAVIDRMGIVFNGAWTNRTTDQQMLFTVLNTQVTAIPEPSTYGLILGASLVIFLLVRRRSSSRDLT